MTSYGVIGRSLPKADAREKATGKAIYAADVQLAGLLHGKILRSPHPHARIRRIDTSKAAHVRGVVAVATAGDATPNRFGQFLADRTVFATDRVRFAGDPVAAVAAVDEATAEEALGLIEVEYGELPAVFDTTAAMSPEAPILHPDLDDYKDVAPSRRYGNVRNDVRVKKGDAAAGFAACDVVLEGRFRAHPSHPGYLEPRACVASWDASGKVTIWSATKAPFRVRTNVADGLGLPLSKVRIVVPALGGDFGGKGGATIEPIAAVLARKAGRPVRLVMTREEEMAFQPTRHPCSIDLKVGATREGMLKAVQGQAIFDVGAYSMGGNGKANTCVNLLGPYRVANADLTGLAVYTNNVPAGQVRAPAGPQTFFAMESMMDELARRLGLDPWEIRRRNALQDGDRSPTGRHVLRNVAMRAAIDAAAGASA
ncbi:MAG: xanthine dehydrogenase family protein molybdopterin-binding subunit [Chloroflexi bacterium]|nr:xanthine dehydrogenase family protein molybdopterin-binding subunit [Chloroflexota bacterium]